MTGLNVTCPLCKKKTPWKDNLFRPFCSDRCRLIDLGKWASDEYRIPGDKPDPAAESSEENPDEQ
jgi:uncharacterized protein